MAGRHWPGERIGNGPTPNREYVIDFGSACECLAEGDQQTRYTTSVAAASEAELSVESTGQYELSDSQATVLSWE